MSELDDLIGDDDVAADPVETVEPVEQAEPVEATGEETAEPPAADKPEEAHVPVAALQSERHKRQELERRVAELQAQAEPQAPPPNPIDDPEGALEHLRNEFSNELWTRSVNASRRAMLREKQDYAEKEAQFIDMAQQDPRLVVELRASEDPAEYAYETARKAAEFAQLQNIDEYKAKLKAEARAEVEAEMRAGSDRVSQTQAEINDAADVGALATSRSSSGQFVAEDDLSSILDGR